VRSLLIKHVTLNFDCQAHDSTMSRTGIHINQLVFSSSSILFLQYSIFSSLPLYINVLHYPSHYTPSLLCQHLLHPNINPKPIILRKPHRKVPFRNHIAHPRIHKLKLKIPYNSCNRKVQLRICQTTHPSAYHQTHSI
jgi:hypothetical protein